MSASNDADEAMIARWETTAHGIYTGDNAVEFARLIALARRATAAEARAEELEALVLRMAQLSLADANGGKNNVIHGASKFDAADIIVQARYMAENKP